MTALVGTNVAAAIVPFTTTDVYASHVSTWGQGGWHEVISTTDRDNIIAARLLPGMIAYDYVHNVMYYLDATSTWQTFTLSSTNLGTNTVVYANMQQASASVLLGNPTGSTANISEITLGSGLSFSGTTLTATGSGGTVTSVALSLPSFITVSGSPITSSGTLTGTLATQSANTFFSGPTTGSPAQPTFRAIVAADLPAGTGTVTSVAQTVPVEFTVSGSPITTSGTLAITKATQSANTVWAGPTSGGATVPTFRALVNADMPSSGAGSGTVTSVGLSLPAIFSVTGSPVTSSGTLTGSLANQNANLIWAGPSTGSPAAPTFRQMVILDTPVNGTPSTSDVLETDSQSFARRLMGL